LLLAHATGLHIVRGVRAAADAITFAKVIGSLIPSLLLSPANLRIRRGSSLRACSHILKCSDFERIFRQARQKFAAVVSPLQEFLTQPAAWMNREVHLIHITAHPYGWCGKSAKR